MLDVPSHITVRMLSAAIREPEKRLMFEFPKVPRVPQAYLRPPQFRSFSEGEQRGISLGTDEKDSEDCAHRPILDRTDWYDRSMSICRVPIRLDRQTVPEFLLRLSVSAVI